MLIFSETKDQAAETPTTRPTGSEAAVPCHFSVTYRASPSITLNATAPVRQPIHVASMLPLNHVIGAPEKCPKQNTLGHVAQVAALEAESRRIATCR